MERIACATLALALAAAPLLSSKSAAHAQNAEPPAAAPRVIETGEPLTIGNTRILAVRTPDTLNGREWTIRDRINHVQDLFAKYLGGQYGKFTWKKWGDRVHLYLNQEFVLAVTPADAAATGYKSADRLAPVWLAALQKGFEESHVRPSTGS